MAAKKTTGRKNVTDAELVMDVPANETVRWLSYTLAIDAPGERLNLEMARLWAHSLGKFGEWRGRIVIFHNQADDILTDAAPGVEWVRVPEAWPLGNATEICLARIHGLEWLAENKALDDCEGVMYADADMIARRPAAPLLAGMADRHDVMLCWEKGRNLARYRWTGGLLRGDEVEQGAKHRGFNAGLVLVRAAAAAEFARAWRREVAAPMREGFFAPDQAALCRLWLRAHLGREAWRFGILPLDSMVIVGEWHRKNLGEVTYREARMYHFAGGGPAKERIARMLAEYLELGGRALYV